MSEPRPSSKRRAWLQRREHITDQVLCPSRMRPPSKSGRTDKHTHIMRSNSRSEGDLTPPRMPCSWDREEVTRSPHQREWRVPPLPRRYAQLGCADLPAPVGSERRRGPYPCPRVSATPTPGRTTRDTHDVAASRSERAGHRRAVDDGLEPARSVHGPRTTAARHLTMTTALCRSPRPPRSIPSASGVRAVRPCVSRNREPQGKSIADARAPRGQGAFPTACGIHRVCPGDLSRTRWFALAELLGPHTDLDGWREHRQVVVAVGRGTTTRPRPGDLDDGATCNAGSLWRFVTADRGRLPVRRSGDACTPNSGVAFGRRCGRDRAIPPAFWRAAGKRDLHPRRWLPAPTGHR